MHLEQERLGSRRAHALEDAPQVGLDLLEVEAAQAVVAAQLDHHDPGRLLQEPVHAGEPAGGRVAADARVHQPEGRAALRQQALGHGGKGQVLVQVQAGGEGVAEEGHPRGVHGDLEVR